MGMFQKHETWKMILIDILERIKVPLIKTNLLKIDLMQLEFYETF